MTEISRSDLIRGKLRKKKNVIRPPWAILENDFLKICERCGECAKACPEEIITSDSESHLPEVKFSAGNGECTFCGKCVEACPSGALSKKSHQAKEKPWQIKASILDGCLTVDGIMCGLCGEKCEIGAISMNSGSNGIAQPEINDNACTGCGGCINVCPAGVIAISSKV